MKVSIGLWLFMAAFVGVGSYIVFPTLKKMFYIFYLKSHGKVTELKPYDEIISNNEGGISHRLLFKSPLFKTEKNQNGLAECINTKSTRRRGIYYDLDRNYSLKYCISKKGKTYLILNQSIFFIVLHNLVILLFGLISLGVGLVELRKIIYILLYS